MCISSAEAQIRTIIRPLNHLTPTNKEQHTAHRGAGCLQTLLLTTNAQQERQRKDSQQVKNTDRAFRASPFTNGNDNHFANKRLL